MRDLGDIATVREAIYRVYADTDVEHAWRRIERLVLCVGYATDMHQIAEDLDGWRAAEQMAIEARAQKGGG